MRVFLATCLWLQTTVLSLTSGISTEDWNVTSPSLKPDVSLEDTTWLSVEKEQNASSLNNSYSLLRPSSSNPSSSQRSHLQAKVLSVNTFESWEMSEVDDENCITLEPTWQGTYKLISSVGISCISEYSTIWEAPYWSVGLGDVTVKSKLTNYKYKIINKYKNTAKIQLSDASLKSAKSVWVILRCSSEVGCNPDFVDINVTIVPGKNVLCGLRSECMSEFHQYSTCRAGSCICNDDGTSGLSCPRRDQYINKQDAIFKASMVAVACFTAVVLSVFILFCYNRAKICRALRRPPHLHAEGDDQRPNDIFSVSDQLARERLEDKPPTYQEVIRRDRENRGIPPPAYTSTGGESSTSVQSSAPSLDQSDDSPEHRSIVRLATTPQTITLARDAPPDSVTRTAVHNNNLQISNTLPPSYDNAAFTSDV